MPTRALLHLAGVVSLVACTAHVDVGDADSGPTDAGAARDSAPDAPDSAVDGGWHEGPPWIECPPRRDEWADPLAEAAAERFFARARPGDACMFAGVCAGYVRSGPVPVPGLPLAVDFVYVGCMNGHLVLSTHDVDCGGELPDAPWAGGEPWTADECHDTGGKCMGGIIGFRCARVRESDCCVDTEACSLDGVTRVRTCNGTCADVFAGGRTWDRCPSEGEALPGERCSLDEVCPSSTSNPLATVHWCDGERYRLVHGGSYDSAAVCPGAP